MIFNTEYKSYTPYEYVPNSNTLGWYPFKEDINDHSSNAKNWYINSGTTTFSNNMCTVSSQLKKNNGTIGLTSGNFTILRWMDYSNSSNGNYMCADCDSNLNPNYAVGLPGSGSNYCTQVYVGGWHLLLDAPQTTGIHHVALVRDDTTFYTYWDGVLANTATGISGNLGNYTPQYGLVNGGTWGEVIFENRNWSTAEIQEYFNQTKSNYGL